MKVQHIPNPVIYPLNPALQLVMGDPRTMTLERPAALDEASSRLGVGFEEEDIFYRL
jgi:hypothetical protein